MRTSDLTGPALAWAVGSIIGVPGLIVVAHGDGPQVYSRNGHRSYRPDLDWETGGPFIEEEFIMLDLGPDGWVAIIKRHTDTMDVFDEFLEAGATPLEAAMRVYVASRLGAEVELPPELQP